MTLYAGSLNPNATDVNGMRQVAGFSGPYGMTMDASGNLYVADYYGDDIRKIATNGMVSTIATGMDMPLSVAVDASGNLYTTFNQLDKVSSNGTVSMVSSGSFMSLTADNAGNIYSATQTQIMKMDLSSAKWLLMQELQRADLLMALLAQPHFQISNR